MKIWLFLISSLIWTQSAWSEFIDPMRPPAYALEKFRLQKLKNKPVVRKTTRLPKKESWVLNSILYSGLRKHAIINNRLVKIGDKVGGAKLVKLRPDSARLISKGKIIDLKLLGSRGNLKSIKKSFIKKKI